MSTEEIARTPSHADPTPSRAQRLVTKATAVVPPKVKQAGQKVTAHWKPTVAGALAVAGATAALVLRRRRAAQSRAARNRWRPGFLQR